MTDNEYIRMRQAEGRGDQSASGIVPAARPSRRIVALMRLARQAHGRQSGVHLRRRA